MNNKNVGVRCIIIVIILLNIINIGIEFLPLAEYSIYCANHDRYMIVSATVIDKKEKIIIYGKPRPLIDIVETKIRLDINGNICYETLYTYPESEISENIMVAIGGNKVRRCVDYKLTSSDVWDVMGYILMTCICMVVYYILSKVETKNNEIIKEARQYLVSDFEVGNYLMIENKKQKIMDLVNARNSSLKEKVVDRSKIEKELMCIVNNHFLWCLEKFTGSEVGNLIFPFATINKEFNFINTTRLFRAQGLQDDYYVISEKNNIIWCCCACEDRVFAYNRGIGITKTKYFDIFDFIIDNLEKESKKDDVIVS